MGIARDAFGNPFRPVRFDLSQGTPTVVALARQMYENRASSSMPMPSVNSGVAEH